MITKLETIVLAAPTVRINRIYPAYKAFYERFCATAVPFHSIKTFALPDVWVRDFLPVQNRQTGKLYQPFLIRTMPIIHSFLHRSYAKRRKSGSPPPVAKCKSTAEI